MMRKLENIFEFYKSTLPVNLALSIGMFVLTGFSGFAIVFLSFGYVVALTMKEVKDVEYYLFYFNAGITKIQLWIFSYLVNMVGLLCIAMIKFLLRI